MPPWKGRPIRHVNYSPTITKPRWRVCATSFLLEVLSCCIGANTLAKGYLISIYSEIHDPEKIKACAADALPALQAHGATPLARGSETVSKEGNKLLRAVVMEFESLDAARSVYKGEEYKGALAKLEGGVDRQLFLIEGL
ncbi:MAG: DUF1330 domain-containing protein [bacterium]